MYLGFSCKHASTVPLVLNPSTGTITPQFHVVFDDWFATVSSSVDDLPDFNSNEWRQLFGDSMFQYILDEDDINRIDDLMNDMETEQNNDNSAFMSDRVHEAFDQLKPATPFCCPHPLQHTVLSVGGRRCIQQCH